MRKKRNPTIVLPGLFWDSEAWVPAEKYPNFKVYSDKILAEILKVSPVRVQTWRTTNLIPHIMQGNFAIYDVNAVLTALLNAGYKQDINKKTTK